MRLVCPKCDAEYEIARASIPRSGREVECSNCGHGWVQAFADLRIDEAVELFSAAAEPSAPDEPLQTAPDILPADLPRPVDEAVLEVLRQEAQLEAKARLVETGRSGLEIQTEMPLVADGDGVDHLHALKATGDIPQVSQPLRPRRDLLPAIEDVSATLRHSPDRAAPEAVPQNAPRKAKPGALSRAFLLLVLAGVILLALYVFAPLIAEKVPALAQTSADYVALMDRALRWTQAYALWVLDWLRSVWRQVAG